jgi:Cu2+-exporting ATPase
MTMVNTNIKIQELLSQTGNADDLLQKIASLNQYSEHPLAQAVVASVKEKNISLVEVVDFEAITGKGVVGIIDQLKSSNSVG